MTDLSAGDHAARVQAFVPGSAFAGSLGETSFFSAGPPASLASYSYW
jgi:hypothetical protein